MDLPRWWRLPGDRWSSGPMPTTKTITDTIITITGVITEGRAIMVTAGWQVVEGIGTTIQTVAMRVAATIGGPIGRPGPDIGEVADAAKAGPASR